MSSGLAHKLDSFEELVVEITQKISAASGNRFGDREKRMVETRLRRRMIQLGCHSVEEYRSYLEAHLQTETESLLSLLTTHHSFFFREFAHFTVLQKNLSEICRRAKDRGDKKIRVWCAACSRGQEVYSLAMFLDYYLPRTLSGMDYEILGSDVDPKSVEFASNGVYRREELKEVPVKFLGRHWARGSGEIEKYVKAKESLTSHCNFRVENLVSLSKLSLKTKVDVIFCRNVFIYFEEHQVKQITTDLLSALHEGGFLISGLSESLGHLKLDLDSLGPAFYRKRISKLKKKPPVDFVPEREPISLQKPTGEVGVGAPRVQGTTADLSEEKPLKLLIVDDSAPIRTLMKKILSKDPRFEVVGSAVNGLEANELVQSLKPDLMTLDIHMPKMDGLTYLKTYFTPTHPRVVVVSSASRDDSDVAIRAIELGASDFVEKPTLNNLALRGEEIKTKLIVAHQMRDEGAVQLSSVDRSFANQLELKYPDKKIRVLIAQMSRLESLKEFLRELHSPQPPTVVLFEGNNNVIPAIQDSLSKNVTSRIAQIETGAEALERDTIYLGDFVNCFEKLKDLQGDRTVSILVFGNCTPNSSEKIIKWSGIQLLVEDLGQGSDSLADIAEDLVPATSFAYLSNKFFAESEK